MPFQGYDTEPLRLLPLRDGRTCVRRVQVGTQREEAQLSHTIYGWEVALVPLCMPVGSGHKGLEGVRVGDSREPQDISAKGWKTSSRYRELKEGKTHSKAKKSPILLLVQGQEAG